MPLGAFMALAALSVAPAAGAQDSAHPASHAPAATKAPSAAKAPYRAAAGAFTITAWDYAFDAPDTAVAGMTEITLVNKGPELHHVQLIRLDDGKKLSDLFAAVGKGHGPPSWAHEAGGPNTPVPGGTSVASVNLEAGRYALLCFIPSPDGKPHVMKGMAREFVVVPATGAKAAAQHASKGVAQGSAPVTITLTDYDFGLSASLVAGKQQIRVVNVAAQPHEVFLVKLGEGRTPADIVAWVEEPNGPPPGMPFGGTTGIATGGENIVSVDLAPGEYALLCFIPDAKDGKMHVMHGMMKQVTVAPAARQAGGS
jgi:hypothetical protein